MAAGLSSRYGGNKLLEDIGGRSMAGRALDAVPADMLDSVVVVTGYREVRSLAEEKGFIVVWNDNPQAGVSLTIRLGLRELGDMDAAMFMVCDQPRLKRTSVEAMVRKYKGLFESNGFKEPLEASSAAVFNAPIMCMSYGGVRGNPCIFSSTYFSRLMSLTGDVGGSVLIKENAGSVLLFEVGDASELNDVDLSL